MNTAPQLPHLYELHWIDSVPSVTDEAVRLARDGAEEGTLVWAQTQSDARGRLGQAWLDAPGNLNCALILRPDMPAAQATQLVYVAMVSLGNAVAELVSPMTELHYRWPNDLLLSQGKAAGLFTVAAAGPQEAFEWLVLGLGVNVHRYPDSVSFAGASLRGEGDCEPEASVLLEGFTRHFLAWINRWAEEGFAPVRKAWLQRANGRGEAISVRLTDDTVTGTFDEIDEHGALIVTDARGDARRVSIAEFFDLPVEIAPTTSR